MTVPDPCCPTDTLPVVNNYQGVGVKVPIQDMNMYQTTPSASPSAAIILIYDIFGHSGHTEQLADLLATKTQCVVVAPDIIGDAWDPNNVPPRKDGKFPEGVTPGDGFEPLVTWITTHPNCRVDRKDTIQAIRQYLQDKFSVTKVGIVGLCWGAKVSFTAAQQNLVDAVAGCHASNLTKEDIVNTNVPMCLLNSKEEPELYQEFKPIMEEKDAQHNVFENYPTMHHGWMGTRGGSSPTDFDDSEVAQQYRKAVDQLAQFFVKALVKKN